MGEPAGGRFELICCRAARTADEIVHGSIMRVAVESVLRPTCEPGENPALNVNPWCRRARSGRLTCPVPVAGLRCRA
jgi:hypothetical protein